MPDRPSALVSTWYGSFLVEADEVRRAVRAPTDPDGLARRVEDRHSGRPTPEDRELLGSRGAAEWRTRDRRLVGPGVEWDPSAAAEPPSPTPPPLEILRAAILTEAERALRAAWDPSVHIEEAVRAVADLDRVRNLVGERLGSWASRDAPEIDPGDHDAAARRVLDAPVESAFGPTDPAVLAARRSVAELYRSITTARNALATAVNSAAPVRTPNLSALLGPELAARLVAQAGSLDRLARLPASTVQVLGAEKAFFEHLRGRAPPPRHGLLFLHPAIQSAPRVERGKLARALAGKAAIAARLDRAGAPVHPELARAFEARRERVRSAGRGTGKGARRRGSGKPLHGAPRDR